MFALIITLAPLLCGFGALARHVYDRARRDFKEGAAFALAENDPRFARALATVLKLNGQLPACAPWYRPEVQDRHVYIMGGGQCLTH